MNAVSSRSHSLLILHIHQANEEDGSSKAGQLNLVSDPEGGPSLVGCMAAV
jgi:hypothetical protein